MKINAKPKLVGAILPVRSVSTFLPSCAGGNREIRVDEYRRRSVDRAYVSIRVSRRLLLARKPVYVPTRSIATRHGRRRLRPTAVYLGPVGSVRDPNRMYVLRSCCTAFVALLIRDRPRPFGNRCQSQTAVVGRDIRPGHGIHGGLSVREYTVPSDGPRRRNRFYYGRPTPRGGRNPRPIRVRTI